MPFAKFTMLSSSSAKDSRSASPLPQSLGGGGGVAAKRLARNSSSSTSGNVHMVTIGDGDDGNNNNANNISHTTVGPDAFHSESSINLGTLHPSPPTRPSIVAVPPTGFTTNANGPNRHRVVSISTSALGSPVSKHLPALHSAFMQQPLPFPAGSGPHQRSIVEMQSLPSRVLPIGMANTPSNSRQHYQQQQISSVSGMNGLSFGSHHANLNGSRANPQRMSVRLSVPSNVSRSVTATTTRGGRGDDDHTSNTTHRDTDPLNDKLTADGTTPANRGSSADNSKKAEGTSALKGCRVSLAAALTGQCLLVCIAFVVMIVVAEQVSYNTALNLVENNLRTQLKYAGTQVEGPLGSALRTIVQVRDRYVAATNYNNMHEPCSEDDSGWASGTTFYSDAVLSIRANPYLSTLYFAKTVPNTSSWDAAAMAMGSNNMSHDYVSQCFVSTKFITRQHGPNFHMSDRLPYTRSDWANLDTLPVNPNPDYAHHAGFTATALRNTLPINFLPYLVRLWGKMKLFVVAVAPVTYNFTSSATGELVRDAEYPYDAADIAALLANTSALVTGGDTGEGVYTAKTVSSIGVGVDASTFPAILESVTPKVEGAHTTLYDADALTLLASTEYEADDAFDLDRLSLFTSGHTSNAELNEAYNVANPERLSRDEISINFNAPNDRVVSAYIYNNGYNAHLAFVQSTPKSHYFAPMVRLRGITIGVGVACAIAVVVLCIMFGLIIRVGAAEIIANMSLAGRMKNDRVKPMHSSLAEMSDLMEGFAIMNNTLLEARAYLPQHMLLSSDSSEDEVVEDEGDVATSNVAPSSLASSHDRRSANRPSGQLNSESAATSNISGGLNNSKLAEVRHVLRKQRNNNVGDGGSSDPGPIVVGGLALKRVTVLTVNSRGFYNLVNVSSPGTIPTPANSLTELITTIAAAHKGVIDSFHGDHFVIGFNAARPNAEGPQKAAKVALEIAASGGRIFSMGVCTSRCAVGQLGTSSLKRLSIIGPAYSRSAALERMCRKYNPLVVPTYNDASDDAALGVQCLAGSGFAQDIQHSYILQVIGAVCGAPFTEAVRSDYSATIGGGGGPLSVLLGGAAASVRTDITPSSRNQTSRQKQDLEVVYALRGSSLTAGKADEWLYEITATRTGKSARVDEINEAMIGFLNAAVEAATGGTDEGYTHNNTTKNNSIATMNLANARRELEAVIGIAQQEMVKSTACAVIEVSMDGEQQQQQRTGSPAAQAPTGDETLLDTMISHALRVAATEERCVTSIDDAMRPEGVLVLI